MSTPISERWDPAVGGGRTPDAFLSSGDDLYWAEPRAVWVLRRSPPPGGEADRLVLAIDPPARGPSGEARVVVAVPRHPDEELGTSAPVHVHVLVPRDPTADDPTLDADALEHAAWGTLYASWDEARARHESTLEADEATR